MTKPEEIYNSYLELCFQQDGDQNLYLRVPTVWDDNRKVWIGFVKTPKTQRLILGEGKDSLELQNSFNKALTDLCDDNDELISEVFDLFKPLSYWEDD